MKLTKTQQKKFDAAKTLYQNLTFKAIENDYTIMFDDLVILPSYIKIDEDSIRIEFRDTIYEMFYANPDYDHGLEKSTAEFAAETRRMIKLVKYIDY